jgi:basic membrane protein A and related proteins
MRYIRYGAVSLGLLICTSAFLMSPHAEAADVKVAYIPCGQVNDGSWSEAGYIGVKDAKTTLAKDGIKVTIDYSESLPPSQAETAARDYASRGYQTIVLHCGTFADGAYNAGKDNPKTHFLIVVAPRSENNVWSYTPAMQDISFVSGVLAARMSKSGVVGTVASFNFSNITWQAEGFRLGARYINPNIKAFLTYINSFTDAGKAKEAAQAMIDSGADVIYSSTDQASRGIYAAAEGAGIYTIASYSDQSKLSPTTVLASALANIPLLVRDMVVLSVQDKLVPGKAYAVGMAGGIGDFIWNPALESKVPSDVKKEVNDVMTDIRAGKLKIPAVSEPGKYADVDLNSIKVK